MKVKHRWFPDADHRFFLIDPSQDEYRYFKTAQERDDAADDLIQEHLDDGWDEDVTRIIAGEVTHHTVRREVVPCPKRDDFENDEEYEDALAEFGGADFEYCCQYKLAPLEESDEPIPAATSN